MPHKIFLERVEESNALTDVIIISSHHFNIIYKIEKTFFHQRYFKNELKHKETFNGVSHKRCQKRESRHFRRSYKSFLFHSIGLCAPLFAVKCYFSLFSLNQWRYEQLNPFLTWNYIWRFNNLSFWKIF